MNEHELKDCYLWAKVQNGVSDLCKMLEQKERVIKFYKRWCLAFMLLSILMALLYAMK